MEGDERMYKNIIKSFLLTNVLSFLLYASGTYAFAADSSDKTDVSKGFFIFIMIVIFIISAAVAGFASFKIKTGSKKASPKDNTQNTKDQ